MKGRNTNDMAARIQSASWGTFLLWVGVCFLLGVSWSAALLGVAVIALGTQSIRARAQLAIEDFWVVLGCVFAAAGLWHGLEVANSVGPIALIAAGAAVVASAAFGNKHLPLE